MSCPFLLQIFDLKKIICLFQYINQLYYQLHLYLKEGAENDGVSTIYCLSKPFHIWSFVIIVDIKSSITSRYLSKPFHIQSFVIIVNLKNYNFQVAVQTFSYQFPCNNNWFKLYNFQGFPTCQQPFLLCQTIWTWILPAEKMSWICIQPTFPADTNWMWSLFKKRV